MIFNASRHCILPALHISNAFQNFVSQRNISQLTTVRTLRVWKPCYKCLLRSKLVKILNVTVPSLAVRSTNSLECCQIRTWNLIWPTTSTNKAHFLQTAPVTAPDLQLLQSEHICDFSHLGEGRDFPHSSSTALGPIQPPTQWVPSHSLG